VQTDIIKRANALRVEQERNKNLAFLMLSSSYTRGIFFKKMEKWRFL